MEVTWIRLKSQMSHFFHLGRNHAPRIKSLGATTTKKKLIFGSSLCTHPNTNIATEMISSFFFVAMKIEEKQKKKERKCSKEVVHTHETCRLSLTFVFCPSQTCSLSNSLVKPPQSSSHVNFKSTAPQLQWLEFLFDLGDFQLVPPPPPPPLPEIAVTTQRPDNVIFSRSKKAVLLIELTIPLEDRVMAGHTRVVKKIAVHMLLWCTYAPKMDGLLVVLRLKWVAWTMYPNLCYAVSNPSWSQAPHPVNFEMSAAMLPIGAVMSSFSEENALNEPPGQWVDPSALLHSPHADLSSQVCSVPFDLCPILPMDLGPQPVQAASCADVSWCPVSQEILQLGNFAASGIIS